MKSFKSLAISTLAAAGTLLSVALSTSAQACTGCSIKLNGTELNGMRVNGIQLNDFKLNGLQFNGWKVNGMRVNGLVLNGTTDKVAGQVIGVTLPAGGSTSCPPRQCGLNGTSLHGLAVSAEGQAK